MLVQFIDHVFNLWYITYSPFSMLLREEMAREVNAVRRKILQLESGGDGFITQYDIKTESFLDKTREKVCFHIVLLLFP